MDIVRVTLPTPLEIESVNCFLLDGDEITLVDAGVASDAARKAFYEGLKERGYAVSAIDRILLTHPHIDHFGLANHIKQESGAQVYAHEHATDWLRDLGAYWKRERRHLVPCLRSMGVPPGRAESIMGTPEETYGHLWESVEIDVEVSGGDILEVGKELTVVETPGHCPASVSFVDEDGSRAFVGDHIVEGFVPTPVMTLEPGTESRARSLPTWVETLTDFRTLDLEIAYAGHNEPVTNVRSRIEEMLEEFQSGADQTAEIVRGEGPLTAYQVHTKMHGSHPASESLPLLSFTAGHLDLLESQGRVETRKKDGEWLYEHT
ncbi:MAG: MBL fold metallo-hydrolase [Halovenus sp.]